MEAQTALRPVFRAVNTAREMMDSRDSLIHDTGVSLLAAVRNTALEVTAPTPLTRILNSMESTIRGSWHPEDCASSRHSTGFCEEWKLGGTEGESEVETLDCVHHGSDGQVFHAGCEDCMKDFKTSKQFE